MVREPSDMPELPTAAKLVRIAARRQPQRCMVAIRGAWSSPFYKTLRTYDGKFWLRPDVGRRRLMALPAHMACLAYCRDSCRDLALAAHQKRVTQKRSGYSRTAFRILERRRYLLMNAFSCLWNAEVFLWPWDLTAWARATGNTSLIVPLIVRVQRFLEGNFLQSAETRLERFVMVQKDG